MSYKENNKWWVSPANYAEEVVSKYNFPKKVEFLDTTLRDGEQQPGIILTKEDKIEIAKKLDAIGVSRIEAGSPATLEEDAEAIREIAKLGLNADIYAFVRNMKKDIDLALECGADGIIAEVVSSQHMLEGGQKWTQEKAIKVSVEATKYAHEKGLKVSYFPADSSRADFDYLMNLLTAVYEDGHVDSIVLVDTMGVLSPEGAAHRVGKLKAAFPDLPVEVHFHNDFGMGVATTIAGLNAGAEVAHVTVGGIGERSGGAPLEATALALEALYGVDTGLDMSKFKELSEFVEARTNIPVHTIAPVVGDKIFYWETGLPSNLWVNVRDVDPLIMLPYHPDVTGHRMPELLLSKKSGIVNLKEWLNIVGEEFDENNEEDLRELLLIVKEYSLEHKKTLDESEFKELLKKFKESKQLV